MQALPEICRNVNRAFGLDAGLESYIHQSMNRTATVKAKDKPPTE